MDKEYYLKWKAEHPNYYRDYHKNNPDYYLNWTLNNPGYQKNYYEESKKTLIGKSIYIAANYRALDRKHGFGDEHTATPQEIIDFIQGNHCIYCGDSDWRHLGLDRIDNNKPHSIDNCVCACGVCNMDRKRKYTVEEFIEYRKTHPRDLKKYKRYPTEVQNGVVVLKPKPVQ